MPIKRLQLRGALIAAVAVAVNFLQAMQLSCPYPPGACLVNAAIIESSICGRHAEQPVKLPSETSERNSVDLGSQWIAKHSGSWISSGSRISVDL